MDDQITSETIVPDRDEPAPNYLDLLRVNDLLVGLDDKAFLEFAARCNFRSGKRGGVLVEEGSYEDSAFFVLDGIVRIAGASEGMEMIYGDISAGQWFGEIAAIDRRERSATVYALSDVVLAVAPREVFINLILEHRQIAVKILEGLAATVRSANQKVVKVGSLSGVQRVYLQVLEMAEPSPEADGTWIISKLPSHDELAIHSVTSKEVVARAVSQLLQSNIAKRDRGHFRILSREKLKQLATQV